MKTKLIFFWTALLLVTISYNGYSDNYYYYNGDTKISLQRVPNKYYLQTYTDIDVSKLELVKDVFMGPNPIIIPESRKQIMIQLNGYEIDFGYWSAIVSDADMSEFEKMEDVRNVAPFFLVEGKHEVFLSNFFHLKLKDADDIVILKQFAEEYSFDIVYNMALPLWFTLSCDKNSAGNALQLANILYETGKFSNADPNLVSCINLISGHDHCNTSYIGITEKQHQKSTVGFTIRQTDKALKITMPNNMIMQRSQIALYNIAGRRQKISPVFNADGTASVSLSNLTAGLYVLHVNDGRGGGWQKQVFVR
ncbi:MAG: T9SS type A sorting domain-containing protein [Treponema sp.]|nr:T9SS type A sorting domain-containing protein [Treponema sp.]